MAYDIFDTYKKRLTESVDTRFENEVMTQEECVSTKSTEDMFDEAFSNVYGIEAENTALNEDFGTFPEWLKKFPNENRSRSPGQLLPFCRKAQNRRFPLKYKKYGDRRNSREARLI